MDLVFKPTQCYGECMVLMREIRWEASDFKERFLFGIDTIDKTCANFQYAKKLVFGDKHKAFMIVDEMTERMEPIVICLNCSYNFAYDVDQMIQSLRAIPVKEDGKILTPDIGIQP